MKKLVLTMEWLETELKSKTPQEIASGLGCSIETLRRKIRGFKIVRSRHSHLIDEHFFDEWSADMAYILGFTYADGSVNTSLHHNQISYQLNIDDIEILEFIKSKIQPTSRIYKYERLNKTNGNQFQVCHLTFSSKRIVTSLGDIGCIPNKTYEEIHLPDVPEYFWGDYLRGLFDGDGSVFLHKGKTLTCNITCHQIQFLQEIRDRIGFGLVKNDKTPKLMFYSKDDVSRLFDMMYNGNFCLTRKFEKFNKELKC